MNKYVKTFLHRGLLFAWGGPVVLGIVYLFIELSGEHLSLNGIELFIAILSTCIIAFVHAGSSVFPIIEHWSKVKSMFFQFLCIYSVYTIAYLINSWLPFDWKILLSYTSAFVGTFLLIWIIVLLTVNQLSKRMNQQLKKIKK